MKSKAWLILSLAGMIYLQAPWAASSAEKPALNFDLLGFSISSAGLGLGKRAQALGEALNKTIPKAVGGQKFQENSYSGLCSAAGPERYELAWYDSETEGFRFSVERLQDKNSCPSPFTDGMFFPSVPLALSQFLPISRSHPGIQLGVSTLDQVRKEMGKPDYSTSDILIYALKRDREKEKGCEMNPKKGELAAVAVQFHFKQGVLHSIFLVNGIAGEC